jgi:hypothetical protein
MVMRDLVVSVILRRSRSSCDVLAWRLLGLVDFNASNSHSQDT